MKNKPYSSEIKHVKQDKGNSKHRTQPYIQTIARNIKLVGKFRVKLNRVKLLSMIMHNHARFTYGIKLIN